MQLLVHRRPAVGHPCRQKHRPSLCRARTPSGGEHARLLVALQLGYELGLDFRVIFARLVAHALEQLLARNAFGVASMIARARDPRGAALAPVHHQDVEVEAGEIDGGGQSRWAAADDQAVENWLVHAQPNGL